MLAATMASSRRRFRPIPTAILSFLVKLEYDGSIDIRLVDLEVGTRN